MLACRAHLGFLEEALFSIPTEFNQPAQGYPALREATLGEQIATPPSTRNGSLQSQTYRFVKFIYNATQFPKFILNETLR